MKKMLALGLLSISLAQAKVFVGVDGGYGMVGYAGSGKVDSSVWDGYYNNSWDIDVNFGYESLFSNYLGTRAFISLGYGQLDKYVSNYNFKVDLNVDAILNFINTGSFQAGLFAGIGVGYDYYSYKILEIVSSYGQIPLYGRLGLSFGISEIIRLDLTTKLPIVAWNIHGNHIGVYNNISYQAGIKFLF